MTESIEYSSKILFDKNHIKSTQILEKIKTQQFKEILNGIGHIKNDCIIIEFKFFIQLSLLFLFNFSKSKKIELFVLILNN